MLSPPTHRLNLSVTLVVTVYGLGIVIIAAFSLFFMHNYSKICLYVATFDTLKCLKVHTVIFSKGKVILNRRNSFVLRNRIMEQCSRPKLLIGDCSFDYGHGKDVLKSVATDASHAIL